MRRNRGTEQYVANKQAAMLQLTPEELLRLINEREGDYYRSDLASPELERAYDNYGHSAGHGNDALRADMRAFYGLNKGLDPSTMPAELQKQIADITSAYDPKPVVAVRTPPERIAVADAPVVPVKEVHQQEHTPVTPVFVQPEPVGGVDGMQGYVRMAGDAVARADDAVQTAIRQKLYGERPDGSYGQGNIDGARAMAAHILHGSGDMLSDDKLERLLYLAGTRGLQAGAITGAGAGLASLISDNEAERGQIVIR